MKSIVSSIMILSLIFVQLYAIPPYKGHIGDPNERF